MRILITGRGLAGSLLAAELCIRGHAVTLMDELAEKSASRTAAGLFNVITGRHASLTWQASTLLDHLGSFFKREVFASLRPFIHYQTIYRTFLNVQEANDWAVKSADPELQALVRYSDTEKLGNQIVNPYGGIEVKPCGWLETGNFLDHLTLILQNEFHLQVVPQKLDFGKLNPETGEVEGLGTWDCVVSAEGMQALQNPFWNVLPLHPLKGQILEVEIPGFDPGFILSRGIFLIPRGGYRFICGSTYESRFENDEVTAEGVSQIAGQLEALVKVPVQVVASRAAIRPTSRDRRPILGRHPLFPKLFVMNGMGTKGVLQAPWCSVQLADLIEERVKILPPEADLSRFKLNFS